MLPLSNYPVSAVSSLTIDGVSIPAAANAQGSGYLFAPTKLVLVGGYRFWRGAAERCRKLHGWLCHYAKRNRAGDDRTDCDALQGARPHRASQQVHWWRNDHVLAKDFSDAIETTLSNYRKVILL